MSLFPLAKFIQLLQTNMLINPPLVNDFAWLLKESLEKLACSLIFILFFF
jgi:hypothetical protein